MDMRHNLPDGQMAYAETMRAVCAERTRQELMESRFDVLSKMLKNRAMVGNTYVVPAGPWVQHDAPDMLSIVRDFAYWMADHYSVDSVISDFIMGRESVVFDQYCVDRIEHEFKRVSDDDLREAA